MFDCSLHMSLNKIEIVVQTKKCQEFEKKNEP